MNPKRKAAGPLLAAERRLVLTLSGVMVLRMLGLFMVLPVLALYADQFTGSTEMLVGLAVGIYGLTQALLQIPAGSLSDRIGRKAVVLIGLLLFAAGSVMAAMADSIGWLIAGRALQGAGAVAAAISAWVADGTRDNQRTKAMALIGVSIGSAFMLALILGPMLANWVGVAGLFWLTAILAAGSAALVVGLGNQQAASKTPVAWREVLLSSDLLRLDIGIFILHAILTATFVAIPFLLRDELGLPVERHWLVYLGVMLASLVILIPAVGLAHGAGKQRSLFIMAVGLIAATGLGLAFFSASLFWVLFWLWLFFGAFNFLEASLPSLVSRQVEPTRKGAALGVYSTCQFLGAFAGAAAAGFLLQKYSLSAVFYLQAGLASLWLLIAIKQRFPAQSD